MKATLSCELPVSRIAVFAEMAWMERRPELALLCNAARGRDKRISVATVQSALPGLSDAGATNVMAWCATLGLCDKHGGLTALGEDVAIRREAPVPEQGVYGMWIVNHPVVGNRALAVERLASKKDPRFDEIKPLPVEIDMNQVFCSVIHSKERFMVRSLPTNHDQRGCVVDTTQAACRFTWTLDFDAERNHWQMSGNIEVSRSDGKQGMQAMHHEPEMARVDLWRLAEVWGDGPLRPFGLWSSKERRLAVSFRGLQEGEIQTFRKTIVLARASVPGNGDYENVKVEDVPIGPLSAEDAQRWAMERWNRRIARGSEAPTYRSRADMRALFVELTEGTPLEQHRPVLPAHDVLVTESVKDPARYWSLAAPVDLAPREVSSDELAALRIGSSPPASRSAEPAGTIRIPYRGGWSMRQVVEKLLGGHAPRKVLLCDRYVRGAENLESLKLFVQAIRSVGSSAVIDVWTSDDDADFKQIQAITGTSARTFRDVFGKNAPHDRYVLVLPRDGRGWAWHLSNSPLDARADVAGATVDTPLRWRDLAGTCVVLDELEPMLRQWFAGDKR